MIPTMRFSQNLTAVHGQGFPSWPCIFSLNLFMASSQTFVILLALPFPLRISFASQVITPLVELKDNPFQPFILLG